MSDELYLELEHLGSPVKKFVDECCVLQDADTGEIWIAKTTLFESFKTWCMREGRNYTPDLSLFARDLMAATNHNVRPVKRTGENRVRLPAFSGIDLKSDFHAF